MSVDKLSCIVSAAEFHTHNITESFTERGTRETYAPNFLEVHCVPTFITISPNFVNNFLNRHKMLELTAKMH